MGKRAFIYAAGSYTYDDVTLYSMIKRNESDLVICADGGYNLINEVGIQPDVIIGDMDSVTGKLPADVKIYTYPTKKDKTDLHICVDFALQNGCDQIILLGVTGGRFSHALGAAIILEYINNNNAVGMILNSGMRIMLCDNEITVRKDEYTSLSIIPLTCIAEGVTTKGLVYPLNDATLKRADNLGISNEFEDEIATISVEKGLLLIICEDLRVF